MQNLELEAETIQVSIYTNIVLNILKSHKELSVNKTLLFSYLIKKEKFRLGKIYNANNTQDVVCKAISLLSGEYAEYCENIKFILKAIHLLVISKRIELNGCLLSWINGQKVAKSLYQESPFIEKAIEESKKMSDRQFMKEVTSNV
jgi:hypothetical protein